MSFGVPSVKLISGSADETEEIGFKLAGVLKAGDVVALYGDLGAGKTTMVKGLARAFGIDPRDVTSASFTIVAEHPGTPPFYHIDLYRIRSEEELEQTGFWECVEGSGVSVIEWPEKIGDAVLEKAVRVRIRHKGNDIREIVIEGLDEKDRYNLQTGKA